jgi:hypothetical protein
MWKMKIEKYWSNSKKIFLHFHKREVKCENELEHVIDQKSAQSNIHSESPNESIVSINLWFTLSLHLVRLLLSFALQNLNSFRFHNSTLSFISPLFKYSFFSSRALEFDSLWSCGWFHLKLEIIIFLRNEYPLNELNWEFILEYFKCLFTDKI